MEILLPMLMIIFALFNMTGMFIIVTGKHEGLIIMLVLLVLFLLLFLISMPILLKVGV